MLNKLKQSELFYNFTTDELLLFFNNTKHYTRQYDKGVDIYSPGECIDYSGIVLSGNIDTIISCRDGNENLIMRYFPGDLIGEAFCITKTDNTFMHARASSMSEIFFFDIHSIFDFSEQSSCNAKLMKNVIMILSRSNIALNKKIHMLTKKTLREKLLTFFSDMACKTGCPCFNMCFNREQLAQYVCSERSSVSRELGRMQDANLIQIHSHTVTMLPSK